MTRNAHGLSRDIPPDVKRQVRKRCGFGCVICGLGIIDYEHVDPEFKDAKTHDPAAIALLCPSHHAKVTRNVWPKDAVVAALKNPKALQLGAVRDTFFFSANPTLVFGGATLSNCPTPVEVAGKPLFSVKPPIEPGGPFLFSGLFNDSHGNLSLQIKDNEWSATTDAWDIESVGGRIVIREEQRLLRLSLFSDGKSTITVEKLDMLLAGYRFEAGRGRLRVTPPGAPSFVVIGSFFDNCQVGMAF
jgi:hypothetical protein